MISFWALRATLAGRRGFGPLVFGAIVLVLALGAILLGWETQLITFLGSDPVEPAIAVFLVCLGWIGATHFLRSQMELPKAQKLALEIQDAERERMAQDIHDGLGQWLSAIKLNLQMLQTQQSYPATDLGEVVGHVDAVISDTRRIAHNLSPERISQTGLCSAMRSHADLLSKASDVQVTVYCQEPVALTATAQVQLYRIFQEALQNALRHGHATEVHVSLTQEPTRSVFSLQDNGQGCDPVTAQPGIGLRSMQTRAQILNSRLEFLSETGQGTMVRLAIPKV